MATAAADASEGIIQIFKAFDGNKQKTLTLSEFSGIILKVSTLSEKEIKKLFKAADTDGNGALDYTEFIQWVFAESKSKKKDKKKKSNTSNGEAEHEVVGVATLEAGREGEATDSPADVAASLVEAEPSPVEEPLAVAEAPPAEVETQPLPRTLSVSVSSSTGMNLLAGIDMNPEEPIAKLREAAQSALGMVSKRGYRCKLYLDGTPLKDDECTMGAGLTEGADVRAELVPLPEVEDMMQQLQLTVNYLQSNAKETVKLAWAPPITGLQQLMFLGPVAEPAVPLFVEFLADPNPFVNIVGAWCLKHVGKASLPALPALAAATQKGNEELRALASQVMGALSNDEPGEVLQMAVAKLDVHAREPTRSLLQMLHGVGLTATIVPELVRITQEHQWPRAKEPVAERQAQKNFLSLAHKALKEANREEYRKACQADLWDADTWAAANASLDARLQAATAARDRHAQQHWQALKEKSKAGRKTKSAFQMELKTIRRFVEAEKVGKEHLAGDYDEAPFPVPEGFDPAALRTELYTHNGFAWAPGTLSTPWRPNSAKKGEPLAAVPNDTPVEAAAEGPEIARMYARVQEIQTHFRALTELLKDANTYRETRPWSFTTECRTYARSSYGQLATEFLDGPGIDIAHEWFFPAKGTPPPDMFRLIHTFEPTLPAPDLPFLKITDEERRRWAKQEAEEAEAAKKPAPKAEQEQAEKPAEKPRCDPEMPPMKFPRCPALALRIGMHTGLPWASAFAASSY